MLPKNLQISPTPLMNRYVINDEDINLNIAIYRYCTFHKLLWPSIPKVLFQTYRHFLKTGLWFSQSQKELAKLTGLCERTIRRVTVVLKQKGIIKQQKFITHCTLRPDGSKRFSRESAPTIFFKSFIKSLTRNINKLHVRISIILSKASSATPKIPLPEALATPKAGALGEPVRSFNSPSVIPREGGSIFQRIKEMLTTQSE